MKAMPNSSAHQDAGLPYGHCYARPGAARQDAGLPYGHSLATPEAYRDIPS